MKLVRLISIFAVLTLTLTTVPQDYSPVADVQAKPPPDKGLKGKGKPAGNGANQGVSGNGKSNKSAAENGKNNHPFSRQFHKGEWDRDWDAGDFLAAGFTTAALYGILGTNRDLVNTGARPLPPGIRKNLARGKALPPGIAMKHPNAGLALALPRILGHEWREIGTDLVLISAGTQIVAQIIRDILN